MLTSAAVVLFMGRKLRMTCRRTMYTPCPVGQRAPALRVCSEPDPAVALIVLSQQQDRHHAGEDFVPGRGVTTDAAARPGVRLDRDAAVRVRRAGDLGA